jgi:sec-independent protein translocase protein TatA
MILDMLNTILLLFGTFGTGEIIIIVFVVLLLFGGKKIPELMKGLGKGVRSFKQGMNEIEEEIKKPADDEKASTGNVMPDNDKK